MQKFLIYAQRAWHTPYCHNQYTIHTHVPPILRTSTVLDLSRITTFLREMLYPQRRNWVFFYIPGFPKGYSDNQLWKECVNSDGQLFHQYHQNEQTPLTVNTFFQLNQDTVLYHIDASWWRVVFLHFYVFAMDNKATLSIASSHVCLIGQVTTIAHQ